MAHPLAVSCGHVDHDATGPAAIAQQVPKKRVMGKRVMGQRLSLTAFSRRAVPLKVQHLHWRVAVLSKSPGREKRANYPRPQLARAEVEGQKSAGSRFGQQ